MMSVAVQHDEQLRPTLAQHRSSHSAQPSLLPGQNDDPWTLQSCLETITADPSTARSTLETAIQASVSARARAESWAAEQQQPSESTARLLTETYLVRSPEERELCQALPVLKEKLDLLNVWEEIRRAARGTGGQTTGGDEEDDDAELADPWADAEDEEGSVRSAVASVKSPIEGTNGTPLVDAEMSPDPLEDDQIDLDLPITLTDMLTLPLLTIALLLASCSPSTTSNPSKKPTHPLLILLSHSSLRTALTDHRWTILAAVPITTSPDGGVKELVPVLSEKEEEKWMGSPISDSVKAETGSWMTIFPNEDPTGSDVNPAQSEVVAGGSTFFLARAERLEEIGLVDIALEWIKCGARSGWDRSTNSKGSGETTLKDRQVELELLVGLTYSPSSVNGDRAQVRWNSSLLKMADEKVVIGAYLKGRSAGKLVDDVREWVVPFLRYRARISGSLSQDVKSTEAYVNSTLHSYILDLPLSSALPIFEASKATLPTSSRIIKSDVDVVRMALAMLYGSSDAGTDTTDRWRTMSRIFECMPMWDVSNRDESEDREVTSTTLESLAAFVAPSTERVPGPQELLLFFQVLGFGALSKALDILDVHLECGEILSKWGVSAPLRVFLITGFDEGEQRAWAVRMARSAGTEEARRTAHMSRQKKDEYWLELLGDMGKLSRRRGEGAFGLLSEEEVQEVFFDGLLSAGNFQLAKKLLNPTDGKRSALDKPMPAQDLERLVLRISNEFFDNAASGNVHAGDMKLAYDCLSVANSSSAVRKQQEFITAVSKLSSYHIDLTPLQTRLTVNKLDLISLVLRNNPDAYKQRETLMDLAVKLGVMGAGKEVVGREVLILGMLADAAIIGGDYEEACVDCDQMIEKMGKSDKRKAEGSTQDSAWRTFLSLGTQTDFGDVSQRMNYIGRSLEVCPTSEVSDILVKWRKLEDARIRLEDAARHRRKNKLPEPEGSARKRHRRNGSNESIVSDASVASQDRLLGSRTAARAARVLNATIPQTAGFSLRPLASATAHLPNILRPASGQSTTSRSSADVEIRSPVIGDVDEIRQQARKALHRGVGWLLGADGEHE